MDQIKTGKLIAQCRREKGLTQQQLADRLHLSNKTISKWESGAGSPDISNLAELAGALELSVDELLKGERAAGGQERTDPTTGKGQLTFRQTAALVVAALGAAIGGVLGILAYNHGWLG